MTNEDKDEGFFLHENQEDELGDPDFMSLLPQFERLIIPKHFEADANTEPSEAVYELAEAYRNGYGDVLQDDDEAIKLYKQAAKLGSTDALYKLGLSYQHGHGVKENNKEAIRYYKEMVRLGLWKAYVNMAMIFHKEENRINAKKCWKLFFESNASETYAYGSQMYLILCARDYIDYEYENLLKLKPIKDELIAEFNESLDDIKRYGSACLGDRNGHMLDSKKQELIITKALNALHAL